MALLLKGQSVAQSISKPKSPRAIKRAARRALANGIEAEYELSIGQIDRFYRLADAAQRLGEMQTAFDMIEKAEGLARLVVDLVYVPGR